MSEIVPAILEETKEQFHTKVSLVTKLPGVKRIQVDFGDGEFVPHKTLSVSEMDTLNPAFSWEAHLMVSKPTDFLDYNICGFKTIIVHYEAYPNIAELKAALLGIKALNLKCGIALNPQTEIGVAKEFDGFVDQFTLLSVTPGFQGGSFITETPARIKQLRALLPNAIIEVDGGINSQNIRAVSDAGAEYLVVGSALVKVADIQAAYQELIKEIT